jgi:hypothetical protein
MKIMEKLKALFHRGDVPSEARDAFDSAGNTKDLLRNLDLILTKNEIEFNDLKSEIDRVDAILSEEEGKIKEGSAAGRQRRYTLQYIKRLRSHLDNLDHRMTIFDKNINLHINLIGRIQDMEAMALRGVDEEQIDKIILDFESHLGRYQDVIRAGESGFESTTNIAEREDRDLEALEREILGKEKVASAEEKPAKEEAAIEPEEEEEEEEDREVMME